MNNKKRKLSRYIIALLLGGQVATIMEFKS